MSYRKIYRSTTGRMIGGVASGIAETYGIDPLIPRLVFVLMAMAGIGVPVYLLCWLLIPADPDIHITIGRPRRVLPLLLKLVVALACVSFIIHEFEETHWLAAAGVGLLIGLFFLWKNRHADGDESAEKLSDFASRFYRSEDDRKFLGVFGGLAESFNVDPTLVRIVGAVVMVSTAPVGFVAYFLYALLVPARRDVIYL